MTEGFYFDVIQFVVWGVGTNAIVYLFGYLCGELRRSLEESKLH